MNSFAARSRQAVLIARREFASYFTSPIAYIVFTLFTLITGVLFFYFYFKNGQASMRPFFEFLPFIFAVFVPAITMKLLAEERSSGSFELLTTMPVTSADIIGGKFFAAFAVTALMLAPTLLYIITVVLTGTIDPGPVLGGYLGALFLIGAYTAVGLLCSSITSNQVVAFLLAFTACIFLALLDILVQFVPGIIANIIELAGARYHFMNFARGIMDSRDVVYFLSVIALCALGTRKIIDSRR